MWVSIHNTVVTYYLLNDNVSQSGFIVYEDLEWITRLGKELDDTPRIMPSPQKTLLLDQEI